MPAGRVWLDDEFPLVHGPDPSIPLPAPATALPDIVVILIESLRAECFEFFYPDAQGCEAPLLENLARNGLVFPRFIANGFPSSEGLVGVTASSWTTKPFPQSRGMSRKNPFLMEMIWLKSGTVS